MPNDSSAVSDLIRQTHGRRLGTDPADVALFDRTNRAQPAPPKRSVVPSRAPARPAPSPRLLDSVLPPLEPARDALARFEPSPQTAEEPEPRTRIWPFIVATLFAAAIGVLMPAYFTGAFDSKDSVPPIQLPSVSPPPAQPPAAIVTPVEPTPPPVAEPVPAPAETTTDPPTAPPAAEVAPPPPAAKVRPKSKRVAIKRAKPAIAKPVAKPTATKPVAPVVEPEPPKPSPPKRQRQAADNENPL